MFGSSQIGGSSFSTGTIASQVWGRSVSAVNVIGFARKGLLHFSPHGHVVLLKRRRKGSGLGYFKSSCGLFGERESKGVRRLGSKHQTIWGNIGRLLGFWAKIVRTLKILVFTLIPFGRFAHHHLT